MQLPDCLDNLLAGLLLKVWVRTEAHRAMAEIDVDRKAAG